MPRISIVATILLAAFAAVVYVRMAGQPPAPETASEAKYPQAQGHSADAPISASPTTAAQAYAEIAAGRRDAGRPVGEADCQIAAICRSRSAVLITRNVRDFIGTGVDVVDPWTATKR